MGSMGSLLHSLTNPEQYCAVGSFSGPIDADGYELRQELYCRRTERDGFA